VIIKSTILDKIKNYMAKQVFKWYHSKILCSFDSKMRRVFTAYWFFSMSAMSVDLTPPCRRNESRTRFQHFKEITR